MKVVFIGAGNLATRVAIEFKRKGIDVSQIYSRTEESASSLCDKLNTISEGTSYITDIKDISQDADLYIFSVKDDALENILKQMKPNNGIWVHTAGSIPMNIFSSFKENYGVFYPLQTFSKTRDVDFNRIPVFIEGKNDEIVSSLKETAEKITSDVRNADSEQRKELHLAAVFACNFTNHMYAIAAKLIEDKGLAFDSIRPLIAETAAKIEEIEPYKAQTGPAIRYDEGVINKHLALLQNDTFKDIYSLLSKSIHEFKN